MTGSDDPILPALKPHDWVARDKTVCRPLVPAEEIENMPIVAFGYDRPHTFEFLPLSDYPSGISPADLKLIEAAAIHNLRSRPAAWKTQKAAIGGRQSMTIALCEGDYLSAEHILDPEFMKQAHSLLKSELLAIGIPRRGILLATRAEQSGEALSAFAGVVSMQYHRADSAPICPTVLLLLEGKIVGEGRGMEEVGKHAAEAERTGPGQIFSSGMVATDETTGEKVVYILAGGEDLARVARTVQDGMISMVRKVRDETAYGGQVKVVLIPELTPKTDSLEDELKSIEAHFNGVAAELRLISAKGDPIQVKVQYGDLKSAWTTLLDDPRAAARAAAERRSTSDQPVNLETLREWIKPGNPGLQTKAALELGRIGGLQAVQLLMEALKDWNPEVRIAAGQAMVQIGAEAVQGLIDTCQESSGAARQMGVWALGRIGDPKGLDALIAATLDAEAEVRATAAEGLGMMKDPRGAKALTSCLVDGSGRVQAAAAGALGAWGDARFAPGLRFLLQTTELDTVRAVTSRALDGLGGGQGGPQSAVEKVAAWAKEEASNRARQIFDQELRWAKRSEHGLVALAGRAPPEYLGQLLEAAADLPRPWGRIQASVWLAGLVKGELRSRAVAQAILLARDESQGDRGTSAPRALIEALIGRELPLPVQTAVAEGAISIAGDLVARGPRETKWAATMGQLGRLRGDTIAPEVAARLTQAALDAVRAIEDPEDRSRELMRLVPGLSNRESQVSVMQEAVAAAMSLKPSHRREERLNWLANHLPYDLKSELLAIADGLDSPADRAQALAGLSARFPEPLKSQATEKILSMVDDIARPADRADVLGQLVAHEADGSRAEIVAKARNYNDLIERATTLAALAKNLPDDQGREIMLEALETAFSIKDEQQLLNAAAVVCAHALKMLKADLEVLLLGEKGLRLRQEAWEAFIRDGKKRKLRGEVSEMIRYLGPKMSNPKSRTSVLTLASIMFRGDDSRQLVGQALKDARLIEEDWTRARVLCALAWYLPSKGRPRILEEARSVVRTMTPEEIRRAMLNDFIVSFSEVIVGALNLRESDPSDPRAFPLIDVALGSVDPLERREQEAMANQAASAAEAISDEWVRARTLTGLAKHFPKHLQARAFKAALQVSDPDKRAKVMITLASHLERDFKYRGEAEKEALSAIESIPDLVVRSRDRARLLEHLSSYGQLRQGRKALEEIRTAGKEDAWKRAHALEALVPCLHDIFKDDAFEILRGEMARGSGGSTFVKLVGDFPPSCTHRC